MRTFAPVNEYRIRLAALLSAWWLTAVALCAQTSDDKVVIADATDQYVFTSTGGKVTVKNLQTTTYELPGNESQHIHPYVFYNDNITIDKASCGKLKPEYRSYTPENVFHDDTKVCFFDDVLTKKHPQQTARFQRTYNDVRMLAKISLRDQFFTCRKTVTVTIPQDMAYVRIVAVNAPEQMTMKAELVGNDSVFTYTVTDMPARRDEPYSPPNSLVDPCLLVTGIFKDYTDLYRWGHRLSEVDTAIEGIDSLLAEINGGCAADQQLIASTFHWVQQNIRYVACEAGIAGFQPDRPAEVLRKRYGDCKGMSLLLKTLLKAQGFDARLVAVGTNQLPYNISDHPSLAAADHTVCAVMQQGQPLFLDATCRYVPVGYVPEHIQGRQAMMEDGDSCQLLMLPSLPAAASVDSLHYDYHLDDSLKLLRGRAVCTLSGDMKENFMNGYDHCSPSEKEQLLACLLDADDRSNKISQAAWAVADSRHDEAVVTGMAENANAVMTSAGKFYVELHPHNSYVLRIDTTGRHNDFYMPLLYNVVREVCLEVPQGYETDHLPQDFLLTTPYARLACAFQRRDSHIIFRQHFTLTRHCIPRQDIPEWNDAVSRWTDACNEQVILKQLQQP